MAELQRRAAHWREVAETEREAERQEQARQQAEADELRRRAQESERREAEQREAERERSRIEHERQAEEDRRYFEANRERIEAEQRQADEAEQRRLAERENLTEEERLAWEAEKRGFDKKLREVAEEARDSEAALDILRDTTPQSIDEVAAMLLSSNKVVWKSEYGTNGTRVITGADAYSGLGESERRKLMGMWAGRDKGGISIDKLAEDKFKELCQEFGIPYDNAEARDALIDMIRTSATRGSITNYIAERRMEQARRQAELERQYEEAQIELAEREDGAALRSHTEQPEGIDNESVEQLGRALPDEEVPFHRGGQREADAEVYGLGVELLRGNGVDVVEVGNAEAQAVLNNHGKDTQLMGSRTDRKMESIGRHFEGRELDANTQAVVDVFSGKRDNVAIEVERPEGTRRVVMRQGKEQKAGTKHSLYRHFETQSNYVTADDIAMIPEIIAKGERSENGNKIAYNYITEGGTRLRVTTEVKNFGREEITNFLSNRKPQTSENRRPLKGDTQSSARTSNAEVSPAKVENKFHIGKSESEDSAVRLKELDKVYLEAVERGDMETVQRMVNEAAERAGYNADSDYQGTSAFNGAAPYNGYGWSKEERRELWDKGEFEGDWTLGDQIDGIDNGDLEFRIFHPNGIRSLTDAGLESAAALREAYSNPNRKITVYRSVPSHVKEGGLRDGDWVTPSLKYAKENAEVHGWGRKYRIIKEEVDVEELWWDGNDINEWGYDSGRNMVYRNTRNNRKLLNAVTYDDSGRVIPLSKRFDSRKADVRYLRTPSGEVYGWTVGGKVYLNRDAMNPETPVHEYTHLWDRMVREQNSKLWERGKELLKQTELWREVENDPNYADLRGDEDAIASEVHSRLTGRDGARLLREMLDRAAQQGYVARAQATDLLGKIRQWMGDMFSALKGTLEKWSGKELQALTLEDFNKLTLRDLAKGVDPRKEGRENGKRLSDVAEDSIRFHFSGEKAAANIEGRLEQLEKAREMERELGREKVGAIKSATGWERGADGKWRYEQADYVAKDVFAAVDAINKIEKAQRAEIEKAREKVSDLQKELRNAPKMSNAEFDKWVEYVDKTGTEVGFVYELYPDPKDREAYIERLRRREDLKIAIGEAENEVERQSDALDKMEREHARGYEDMARTLEDVLGKDNELFAEYPQMRSIKVTYDPFMSSRGSWSQSRQEIKLNPREGSRQMRFTLVHELQHAIQHAEGFTTGTSPEYFFQPSAVELMYARINATLREHYGEDADAVALRIARGEEVSGSANLLYSSDIRCIRQLYNGVGEDAFLSNYHYYAENGARNPENMYWRNSGEVEARNAARRLDSEQSRRLPATMTEDVARNEQHNNPGYIGLFDVSESAAMARSREDFDSMSERAVEPTEAQKKAGNYKMEHRRIDGLKISIENPKGSTRRGTDADGTPWETRMNNDYGYIRGTTGADGDKIDVFLSDNPAEGDVYVVDQYNKDGSFDEHKVMYGFKSAKEAEAAYRSNYSADWGNNRKILVSGVSRGEFRKWLDASDRKTKPFGEYKGLKTKNDSPGFIEAVKTLYEKGKDVAARLFNRSFFDVARTPGFMKNLGLKGEKFTIRYGVIARHFGKDGSHDLSEVEWSKLPEALQRPFAISKLVDKKDSYRIYTTLQNAKGEYVVVGVDVKNAGRDLEVNAIATVFGRRNDAGLTMHEQIIYTDKNITPNQQSLLDGPNSRQYPADRELSGDKDNTLSSDKQGNGENSSENIVREPAVGRRSRKVAGVSLFDRRADEGVQGSLFDDVPAHTEPGRSLVERARDVAHAHDADKANEVIEGYAERYMEYADGMERRDRRMAELEQEIEQRRAAGEDTLEAETELEALRDEATLEDSSMDEHRAEAVAQLGEFYRRLGNTPEDADRMAIDRTKQTRAEVEIRRAQLASRRRLEEEIPSLRSDAEQAMPTEGRGNYSEDGPIEAVVTTAGGDRIGVTSMGALPKLKEGDFALVERRFIADGMFTFDGKQRIESVDDVAYIFRKLEDFAQEHSFVVMQRADGSFKVVHTGMGNAVSTIVDMGAVRAAYEAFGADKIWFVHNHPSGTLEFSRADESLIRRIQSAFAGDVSDVDAIIINTRSGKYITYNEREKGNTTDSSSESEVGVELFGGKKFADDYNADGLTRISGSSSIADYVAQLRLGEGVKSGYLILDNGNKVMANIVINGEPEPGELAREMVSATLRYGGKRVVRYSNGDNSGRLGGSELMKLKNQVQRISMDEVSLLDNVDMRGGLHDGGNYSSAFDNGLLHDSEAAYGSKSSENFVNDPGAPATAGSGAGPMSAKERVMAYMLELDQKAHERGEVRNAGMAALGKMSRRVEKAMRLQQQYDAALLADVTGIARSMMGAGLIDSRSRLEVSRTMAAMRSAVSDTDIKECARRLMNVAASSQLRILSDNFEKLVRIKARKKDAHGVSVAGSLDFAGQEMLEAFNEGRGMSSVEPLSDRINEIENRLETADGNTKEIMQARRLGFELAMRYKELVSTTVDNELELKSQLEYHKGTWKECANEAERRDYREKKAALEENLRDEQMKAADALRELTDIMFDQTSEARERLMEFRRTQDEHRNAIYHNVNSDLEGRAMRLNQRKLTKFDHALNSFLGAKLLLKPLGTFEQMMREFGRNSINGEGYLFDRFVRGWQECRDKQFKQQQEIEASLDEQARTILGGNVTRWSDIYRLSNKKAGTLSWSEGKYMEEHDVTEGQLVYIYMVNKMPDGRMKLRHMGIDEAKVNEIEARMNPKLKALADWMQQVKLPELREVFNDTHIRVFGSSMAEIEDYFPLHILKGSRLRNVVIDENGIEPSTPNTIVGAIRNRTKNACSLDILNCDAFSVMLDHVRTMTEWNNFAQYNKDLGTLLSYNGFTNKARNMRTAYGSGDKFLKNFEQHVMLAGGSHKPKTDDTNKSVMNLMKLGTASCIAFRVNTAIKQILSAPAFNSEARADDMAYCTLNSAGSVKWAIQTLPAFERRWKDRLAGNEILRDSDADWDWTNKNWFKTLQRIGITPNAAVDAYTCAIGARAVYRTKLRNYLKEGFDQATAHKKACSDAEIAFNLSQQSSENIYLSTMQNERNFLTSVFTVFRNSPMSYARQTYQSARELYNSLQPGGKERQLAFETKKLMREGLTQEQADYAAQKRYYRNLGRNVFKFFNYAALLPSLWAWGLSGMWYSIFGDDPKKKLQHATDALLRGCTFGWAEGFIGGGTLPDLFFDGFMKGEWHFNQDTMPAASMIADCFKLAGQGKKEQLIQQAVNTVVSAGIGVNPQVLEDVALAGVDFFSNEKDWRDYAIMAMRIIQAPQSQIDQVYLDKIGMSAAEAKAASPAELAERYAIYKMRRQNLAGLMITDAQRREALQKDYQGRFEKIVEGLHLQKSESEVLEALEKARAREAEFSEKSKRAKEQSYVAMAEVEREKARDFGHQMWSAYKGGLNVISKEWLRALDGTTAAKAAEDLTRYRVLLALVLECGSAREAQRYTAELNALNSKYAAMKHKRLGRR